MTTLKVKFDKRQVSRALRKVKAQTKNTKPVMNRLGKLEVKKAQHRVRSSKTDPKGRKWAPWSYETLKARNYAGDAGKGLLYKSGNLLRRFTYKLTRQVLKISNSAPYAKYLQNGTRNMPARPFLGWDKNSTRDLTKRFDLWIKRGWK